MKKVGGEISYDDGKVVYVLVRSKSGDRKGVE